MSVCRSLLRVLFVLTLALAAAAPCAAQDTRKPVEPEYGQPGKDVVWVPTTPELIQKMLDLAGVTASDYVIDLGSGDGRTVIAAAKRGARASGIEYNQDLVDLSTLNAKTAGVAATASFAKADLFDSDLSQATVITMFLLTDINIRLRPQLLDLAPGTRIVTNTFRMGSWEPDDSATVEGDCTSWCTAFLWIVPAKVEGAWTLGDTTLTLSQNFQMVSGTLGQGHVSTALVGARLRGDDLRFTIGDAVYTGKVRGTTMSGSVKTGSKTANWSATR